MNCLHCLSVFTVAVAFSLLQEAVGASNGMSSVMNTLNLLPSADVSKTLLRNMATSLRMSSLTNSKDPTPSATLIHFTIFINSTSKLRLMTTPRPEVPKPLSSEVTATLRTSPVINTLSSSPSSTVSHSSTSVNSVESSGSTNSTTQRLMTTPTSEVPKPLSSEVTATLRMSPVINTLSPSPLSTVSHSSTSVNSVESGSPTSSTTQRLMTTPTPEVPKSLSSEVTATLRMSSVMNTLSLSPPSTVSDSSTYVNSVESGGFTNSTTQRLMTTSPPTPSKTLKPSVDSKETWCFVITGSLGSAVAILLILVIVFLKLMLKYKHKATKGITRSVFLKKGDVADDRYIGTFKPYPESTSNTLKSEYFYVDVEGEFCQVAAANLTCNEGYRGVALHPIPAMENGYAVPSCLAGSVDALTDM